MFSDILNHYFEYLNFFEYRIWKKFFTVTNIKNTFSDIRNSFMDIQNNYSRYLKNEQMLIPLAM